MNKRYKGCRLFGRWMCIVPCMMILFSTGKLCAVSGQEVAKLNLMFKNAEIKTILREIKAQSEYDFVYSATVLDDKAKVSLDVRDADVKTVLKVLLDPLKVDFVINGKIIVLQKREPVAADPDKKREISGIVTDEQGVPLPGVAVMLKGTTLGVATDTKGGFKFTIASSGEEPVLLFSFIGMKPVEYKLKKDETNIRVVMKEDSETLDEVVVTGMEVIKKERMTGSASVITAKDLQMQGVTSIDRILEGKIAGLNSTTISGAPGTRSKITIRGENNLSSNTEPLWIVDGLPMLTGVPTSTTGDYAGTIMQDGVGNIMPEDIESISILKDASAAAIYGARAANGVIVITTKKGFRSKTQVSYSGTYQCGIAPRNRIDFMNTTEKLQYEKSIIDNFGLNYAVNAGRGGFLYKRSAEGYLTPAEYEQELKRLSKINTDWFNVIFRTAQSHSHNISLRGGNEELTYYTSVNYQQQNGILLSNSYENAGVLVKLDYRPIKNLILALNVSVNSRKNEDHASAVDPFKYAVFANTYERPYDDDGNYASDLSYLAGNRTSDRASGYKFETFNILREMNETKTTQTGLDAELTFDVRYEVIPGLALESIIRKAVSYNTTTTEVNAGTYTSWKQENFAASAYKGQQIPDEFNNGSLSEGSGRNNSWSIRNQIDYSLQLKESHVFSILVANEVTSKKFNNSGYTSPIYYEEYRITGVPTFDHDVSYEDVKGNVAGMFHTSDGQDRTVSFLGSFRYSFKDRYVFNFNYRADGADAIGNTNRFTPLWSVGVRYNLHKEKFFKNKIVNELAIRGSYGYTGNIDRSAYPFSTIGYGSNQYMGNLYANSFTFPNPSVSWEKKQDRNIGLEISLLNSRISFTAEYYSNRTEDVLDNLEIPISTGRSSVRANGGIVENSGVELYLNLRWVNSADWVFSTSVNLARNKNMVKKSRYSYDSYEDLINADPDTRGGIVNIVGKETGGIYGWKYAGVNPETGNPQFYLTEAGKRAYSVLLDNWYDLGDADLYKKILGSMNEVPDKIDFIREEGSSMPYMVPSMQYLGRSNPKYVGGFSTYLKYKGLEFTTSWTFKTGHIIPNFNDCDNAPRDGGACDLNVSGTNREKRFLYYWQAPGDITDVARFTYPNEDKWAFCVSSDDYSKGDYLRMTNLSLSYRFPKQITSRLKMSNLLLGFNARNLLTFTKYRGWDVGTEGSFTYPASREFNFKLTVGF